MSKGLYFYKLVSPYEEDHTLNCKLTVNQIDSNFLSLKDVDILRADLDEENKAVVLTRNNGEQLVVDLTPILSGAVYDLEITVDNPSPDDEGVCNGMNVYVSYSTLTSGDAKERITVPITGIVTTDNISEVVGHGDNYMTKVITDGTLHLLASNLRKKIGLLLVLLTRQRVKNYLRPSLREQGIFQRSMSASLVIFITTMT